MRVSVVATGIDALAKKSETPVARRSMAAPLAPIVDVEPVAEPQAEPAAAPIAEPVAASTPQERTLFENLDAPAPRPQQQTYAREREFVQTPRASADDLPPPAYTPRAEPELTEADNFVAPRAQTPGTPSPEALARLQAAVNRVPKTEAPRQAAPAPSEPEKPRFGINSLINRMTGAQADGHAQQPARAQPQVTALRQDPEPSEDQDKIEIPAFLRRQAN